MEKSEKEKKIRILIDRINKGSFDSYLDVDDWALIIESLELAIEQERKS